MKRFSLFLLCVLSPLTSIASECALSVDEGLTTVLNQDGTLESVLCERNVNADLEITIIFRCNDGVESPLFAVVDRNKGESWCGVQWIDCGGNVSGYQTPEPVAGKSSSEDFASIRNACSELF